MQTYLKFIGVENTKIGAVLVNITDYKPFTDLSDVSVSEIEAVRLVVRKLRDALHDKHFIRPGQDKVTARLSIQEWKSEDQYLVILLSLGEDDDDAFARRLKIPLPSKYWRSSALDLFDALAEISTLEPGGNVPNMIRNLMHALRSGVLPLESSIHLFSSSLSDLEQR